jgi:5-hydroxyisourate hydrolase
VLRADFEAFSIEVKNGRLSHPFIVLRRARSSNSILLFSKAKGYHFRMISTHILDLAQGNPAAGIEVELWQQSGEAWNRLEKAVTNGDGRIAFSCPAEAGTYRLMYKTTSSFFQSIPVVFTITDTKRKYHIPLLLSPFGYSTYRGS